MSNRTQDYSTTQAISSVMPGEDAVIAGGAMESMPDDATAASIVDRLPGEATSPSENAAMADFSSFEMPATEGTDDVGMLTAEMDTAITMPGEEGLGTAMADRMPGEELSTRDAGKAGAEISGTFRLTLMPV